MRSVDIVRFLLDRDVLQSIDVVERGLRIVNRPRERFVIRELSVGGRTVAYIKELLSPSGRPYLEAEIATLVYLDQHPALATIAPQHLASDAALGVVVMAPVDGAPGTDSYNPASIDALAQLLAALHRGSLISGNCVPTHVVVGSEPWIVRMLDNDVLWRPPALAVVWPFVRDRAGLQQAASDARKIWVTASLIHGDIKWEHCFFAQRPGKDPKLALIDWELSGVGDPAWDVASALAELLFAAPLTRYAPSRSSPSIRIKVPLALKRFIRTYHRAFGPAEPDRAFVHRVTLFTAFRMFQASLERATTDPQDASSIRSLVQQADWILAAREPFAAALLGSVG
jgi:Phosphotransferase enzyme family